MSITKKQFFVIAVLIFVAEFLMNFPGLEYTISLRNDVERLERKSRTDNFLIKKLNEAVLEARGRTKEANDMAFRVLADRGCVFNLPEPDEEGWIE